MILKARYSAFETEREISGIIQIISSFCKFNGWNKRQRARRV